MARDAPWTSPAAASGSAAARTSWSPRSTRSAIDPAGRVAVDVGRLDRRVHGRAARPRRDAGLRGRRRVRPARRAAPARPAGRVDGAGQRADARPPRRCPEPVDLAVVDVVVHLARPRARRRSASVLRDGAGPIVALVKPQFEAGQGRRQGRRRARPGGPPPRAARDRGARRGRRARDARRDPVADPGAGGQPRVPRPCVRAGPSAARTSTRGSTARSRPPGRAPA